MGMDKKTASWFAYILSIISGVIVLATEKDDKDVRTQAWQSVVMGCFFVAVYIVLGILAAIFFNPWNIVAYAMGAFSIWGFLYLIAGLAWLVLTVICILKALQGDIFKIPVIYDKVKNFK
ncbi:MAG: DUF4870 domain-containing protein [Burkholderiales bacterium]